jgi:hypothetical protein
MFKSIVDFTSLLSAALLAGAMFGAWLMLNPKGMSAPSYIRLQQQAIRRLHRSMPPLGAVTLMLTVAAAALDYRQGKRDGALLLLVSALCFATAGLITRFRNMPINAVVISWSVDAPPAQWQTLRDSWWRWHRLRTLIGVLGLGTSIVAALAW